MPKSRNEVEQNLIDRFDKALESLNDLSQNDLDYLCDMFSITVYKIEYKEIYPTLEDNTTYTVSQYRALVIKHLATIPAGFTYSGNFTYSSHNYGQFKKKTYLFNHKNHQVNKLKQKINLDLLLSSAGKSKEYYKLMAKVISFVDSASKE